MCLVVKIREADSEKLVKRLRHIRKEEKIRVDDKVLRELAESTGNDARSSINTLQFLSALKQDESISYEQLEQLKSNKDAFNSLYESTR